MRTAARALLLLFVFTIPWEYSLDLGVPFGNIARVMGLIAMAAAVTAVLRAGSVRKPGTVHWLTLGFYLYFCCSFLWTLTQHITAAKLRGYAQEMVLVWLIWELIENSDDLRNLMRAWLAGSWVLGVLTLVAFVGTDASTVDQIRFAAMGQDPNDTARYVALGLPIAALLAGGRSGWFDRAAGWGYFPIAFAAVMLTGSRSGILVAMVAFVGSAIMVFKGHSKRIAGALIAFPAIAGVVVAGVPRGTVERLETIRAQLQNGDLNQRVNIWSAGWRAFVEAPILGHGAGSFATAARLFPEDTAHNTVLTVLVEGGLCALLLATAILLVSLGSISKTVGTQRIAMGTAMAAWLVAAMVSTSGENRLTWLLLGTIAVAEHVTESCEEVVGSAGIPCRVAAEETG